jgi:GH24 family phage-related lysozyme (muramidase)
MAKFPTYQRQQGLSVGSTASFQSAGAFAAPGQALAQAGNALQSVGDEFTAVALKHLDEADNAWLAKAKAGTISEYETAKLDLRQRATGDASTHVEESDKAYGGIVGGWEGRAPSDRARAKYREWADGWSVNPRVDAARFRAESEIAGKATSLSEAVQGYANAVYSDPSKFDQIQAQMNADLDAARSWMTPEQEAKIRAESERALTMARARREVEINPEAFLAETGAAPVDPNDAHAGAAALLRDVEGFRDSPYWDVNAHRVGYGSDTITRADGTVVKVQPGMRITREDAERDLQRRIAEFESTAKGQVGEAEWNALPASARAALISVTYNYGSLPSTVVDAIKTGDVNAVASAVEGLSANKSRRQKEAAIIRGQSGIPETSGPMRFAGDPRYAGLSYDEIGQLRGQAQGVVDATVSTQRAAIRDRIELEIASGGVVTRDQILSSPLPDGDKATLLGKLDDRDKYAGPASELNKAIIGGGKVDLNPFDPEQAKVGDKAYSDLMARVPDENRASVQRDWVGSTGYIPKNLVAELRYNAGSNDPARLAAGLSQADAIEREASAAWKNMDGASGIQPRLDMFRHYVNDLGMSSEEAARKILDAEKDINKRSREMLKTDAKSFVSDLTVGDVTNAFDPSSLPFDEPGAGISSTASNALLAEYRAIAEEKFYETGGDADAAKALALAEIKRTWGVSNISGEAHVVRLPPEQTYPAIGGSHEYLREDALETAKGYVAEAFPDRTVKNIFVMADEQTRADIAAGRPPRYRLFYTYEQDGFELTDEVVGSWGVDAKTQEKHRGSVRDDFFKARQGEDEGGFDIGRSPWDLLKRMWGDGAAPKGDRVQPQEPDPARFE